jgi:hypothetical protein
MDMIQSNGGSYENQLKFPAFSSLLHVLSTIAVASINVTEHIELLRAIVQSHY